MAFCPPFEGRWAAPQAVAAELGGRDAQQVKHHFLYVQNQNLRKGPWTKEEDAALLKAHIVFLRDHVSHTPEGQFLWAASPACVLLAFMSLSA